MMKKTEERKVANDWGSRTILFDSLVESVMAYGAEVWGWQEYFNVERVETCYLKWSLG